MTRAVLRRRLARAFSQLAREQHDMSRVDKALRNVDTLRLDTQRALRACHAQWRRHYRAQERLISFAAGE